MNNIPHIEFQEGSIHDLILQLQNRYGGEIKDQHYTLSHDLLHFDIRYFRLTDGIEITLNSIKFKEDHKVTFYGNKGDNRHLCFRFSYQGDFMRGHTIENSEVQPTEGMAIFDTALTFDVLMRKGQLHQWVGIRVSNEVIQSNFLMFGDYFGDVFNTEKTWLIYDHTPLEILLLLKELFNLKDLNKPVPVENSIIIARASEAIGLFYERILGRDISKGKFLHQNDLESLFKIKDDILSSYELPPSLEEIAEQYGFSVSKLRRDFKNVYGTSIHRFHQNYRLEQAKISLATDHLSITEIARKYGYKSISKFSYAFKKKFGKSPSEFQNS
ncbi:helix-turn-helix transcriptional regulator [Flammeovirga sp. EKP202]|uniref:helix-turn-helix transcriptional regulator n=1 Tax=Flammeovirga sp. EKP202 TaxID=2770592 RepID=UPI00165F1DEE|nr:AraC family transcriptional regulator [Flammeovirga sp. EKP202]MBD0401195.1 helix-turn-helix transcriptional regulator [Flammeovirga sp. EKP202]